MSFGLRLAQVTAVDEHELRHPAHLFDIARRQEGVLADDHARHAPLRFGTGFAVLNGLRSVIVSGSGVVVEDEFVLAVAGQVQDAPGILVQSVHQVFGVLVDAVPDPEAAPAEQGGHFLRLVPCAGQFRKLAPTAEVGIAYDESRGFGCVMGVEPELGRLQLADQARAHRPRTPTLAPAILDQFPRIARGDFVDQQNHVGLLGRKFLELIGQQHLEQRLGHFRIAGRRA